MFKSGKIKEEVKLPEKKPPIVNQQCVVYKYKCDLCNADYVGYTSRHLHQRIDEHKRSVIGKHVNECHGEDASRIEGCFSILRKCPQGKYDCLLFEMLYIKELKPSLNVQSDSIRSKLYT